MWTQENKDTLGFLIGVCSLALLLSLTGLLVSIWNSVMIQGIRTEQLSRTKNVYNVELLQERVTGLEQDNERQWKALRNITSQTMEARQQ